MKRTLKSLFARISIVFFVLLMTLVLVQMYLSLRCTFDYYAEKSRKQQIQAVKNLARILESKRANGISNAPLNRILQTMFLLNPSAKVALTDSTGSLKKIYNDAKLDTKTQEALQIIQKEASHPIIDYSKLNRELEKTGYAASRIHFNGQIGSLLVTLNNTSRTISLPEIFDSPIILKTALFAIAAVIISLFIGFFLFFRLTHRLNQMRDIVHSFEKGNYNQRIPVTSQDEIGEVGKAFNHMADRFEKYIRQLEQNDHLRRELIANISHDLRSPLASVQGYVETILMKNEQLSPTERRQFLKISLKNIVQLNEMVEELFELAKFDAQQITPHFEPFSIAELAQDIALKFQPQAKSKNIKLKAIFSKDLPLVFGDVGMIDRVISNLIQNALNFNTPKGTVILSLNRIRQQVEISVQDTGPGIPAKDLPHIFERFYRVEKSRTRNSGSTGLGLAIVKEIINAHGATITVKSTPNEGTIFSFRLPVWHIATHEKSPFNSLKVRSGKFNV